MPKSTPRRAKKPRTVRSISAHTVHHGPGEVTVTRVRSRGATGGKLDFGVGFAGSTFRGRIVKKLGKICVKVVFQGGVYWGSLGAAKLSCRGNRRTLGWLPLELPGGN